MTYGPPPPDYRQVPEYPRATSSPPIIVLVSGLAALLGFLLGVFVGFGAQTTSPEEDSESEPRVTVTVEDSPESTPPADTPPQATSPAQPPPSQPLPSQTLPSQTPPGQTPPSETFPGQTPPGGGTTTSPAFSPASLRTLVVGRDIQPGTYRTTGPTAGFPLCYWARLRDTTGDAIATGMPAGPASVTIQATDKAFQTGGCAEWTRG